MITDCARLTVFMVQARRYVDQRSVQLQKPLIDSGTSGTKGSVQVTYAHGLSKDSSKS